MDIQEVPQSNSLDKLYLDLATILLDKGLSKEEVYDLVIKIAGEVEIRVIHELMNTLPEDKISEAKNMSAQGMSGEEIMKELGLVDEQVDEIERRMFAEVVQALVPSLNAE